MTSSVVPGLGGCVHYEQGLLTSLERLIEDYQIHAAELISGTAVRTERDLLISILDYIRRGGCGERFVASTEVLAEFARGSSDESPSARPRSGAASP
jgi:hypothetical protein